MLWLLLLNLKNVSFLIKHDLLLVKLLLQQTPYLQNVIQLMLYRKLALNHMQGDLKSREKFCSLNKKGLWLGPSRMNLCPLFSSLLDICVLCLTKKKKNHPKVNTCHLHQIDFVLHVSTLLESFLICNMWILEMQIFLVQIQTL